MRTDFHWPFPGLFVVLFGRYTRMRQVSLLWVIAAAVERQLPLAPLVDAFSDDTRGPWQSRIRDLAHLLRTGTPLPAALDAIPGVVPRSAILAAHVGAESGTLGAALRAEATALSEHDDLWAFSLRVNLVYFLAIILVCMSVVGFIAYYIVPKFIAIFQDFGVELPPMTVALIHASNWLAAYFFLLPPAVLLLLWIPFFMSAGQLMSVGGPFSRVFGRFSVPGILRNLSVVIAAGRPLTSATATLAAFHPIGSVRRRLLRIDGEIENGAECWASMRKAGFLTQSQVAVLQAAQRAGNLAWALRLLADRVEKRIEYRIRALLEFVRPILLLCLGAVIGFVVIAMFMPLLKLLNDLS